MADEYPELQAQAAEAREMADRTAEGKPAMPDIVERLRKERVTYRGLYKASERRIKTLQSWNASVESHLAAAEERYIEATKEIELLRGIRDAQSKMIQKLRGELRESEELNRHLRDKVGRLRRQVVELSKELQAEIKKLREALQEAANFF